jgi:hypothetical protein
LLLSKTLRVENQAYKPRTKGVPVKNTESDTGRTVYVNPETLENDPGQFQKIQPDHAGDPRWRGKPKPPKRPARPQKPEVPRDPPPAPVRPQDPKKLVKPAKPVVEVKDVPKMKVPEPSPQRRWKKLKKFTPLVASESVVLRFLAERDE